jgi:hypothetical protein
MTPLQQAAISNTNLGASAFGLGGTSSPMAGMPQMQTFAGGLQGYSSGGLYDQALAQLQARNPGQFAALQAPFINPQTGAPPTGVYGAPPPPPPPSARSQTAARRDPNEPRQGSASSRNTKYDTYSTAADTKARADKAMAKGAPSRPSTTKGKK